MSTKDYADSVGWKLGPESRPWRPLAVITLMLNEPVPAARKVLERAGMTLDDIDLAGE